LKKIENEQVTIEYSMRSWIKQKRKGVYDDRSIRLSSILLFPYSHSFFFLHKWSIKIDCFYCVNIQERKRSGSWQTNIYINKNLNSNASRFFLMIIQLKNDILTDHIAFHIHHLKFVLIPLKKCKCFKALMICVYNESNIH